MKVKYVTSTLKSDIVGSLENGKLIFNGPLVVGASITRRLLQKFHIQLRGRAEQPDRVAFRARIWPHVRQARRTEKVTAQRVHTHLALSVKAFGQAIFAFEQVAFLPGWVCLPGVIR